jgi:hypothetical protein
MSKLCTAFQFSYSLWYCSMATSGTGATGIAEMESCAVVICAYQYCPLYVLYRCTSGLSSIKILSLCLTMCYAMKAYIHGFFTSALVADGLSASRSCRSIPGESARGTQWIGRRLGGLQRRSGHYGEVKLRLLGRPARNQPLYWLHYASRSFVCTKRNTLTILQCHICLSHSPSP